MTNSVLYREGGGRERGGRERGGGGGRERGREKERREEREKGWGMKKLQQVEGESRGTMNDTPIKTDK